MASPSFHEFKRQASSFLKEKIKTARLVLTDVTPAELLTEEATEGDSWAPDTPTMGLISRAAFEVDDYWRIVNILHKRLWKFNKENWRASYKGLVILEHLLTHGPERVLEEFQCDKEVIKEMGIFQHVDEKGFNWGLRVREKSERILKLLDEDDKSFLKEERGRARKITSGIKGFGSFSHRRSSLVDDKSLKECNFKTCLRCNSQCNDRRNQEGLEYEEDGIGTKEWNGKIEYSWEERELGSKKIVQNSNSWSSGGDGIRIRMDDDHPFCEDDHHNHSRASLL